MDTSSSRGPVGHPGHGGDELPDACRRFLGDGACAAHPAQAGSVTGSIVWAATVLPIVVRSGPAAGLAVAATAGVMIVSGNSFLAVAVGVGMAALLHAFGIAG